MGHLWLGVGVDVGVGFFLEGGGENMQLHLSMYFQNRKGES